MPSNAPIFADLFYAVVIGIALSNVDYNESFIYYVYIMSMFIPVLEDWYVYYKSVKPTIVETQKYTMHSLIAEFAILFFWSMAFRAIEEKNLVFVVFFAMFMTVRLYAGVRHHIKKGTTFSVPALREYVYGLSAVVSFALYVFYRHGLEHEIAFVTINFLGWLVSIAIWWTLYIRLENK